MSHGLTPTMASCTILWRTQSGNGLPFTKTPPNWFTPACPGTVDQPIAIIPRLIKRNNDGAPIKETGVCDIKLQIRDLAAKGTAKGVYRFRGRTSRKYPLIVRSRSPGKVGRCIFWHAVLASPLMTSLRRISRKGPSPSYPSIRPFCSQRQRRVIISCNIRKEIVRSDFTAKSRRLFTPRGSFVINVESGEHYAALMQPELRDKHIKCSLTYTTTLVSTLMGICLLRNVLYLFCV